MSEANLRGTVEAALVRASAVHAGQTDKAGEPYIDHPKRVASKLDDKPAKTAALLHDVIEDTATRADPVTADDLRAEFADDVADAVVALTRRDGEPSDDYYARVRANPLALRVKLADIHDNLEPSRLTRLDDEQRRYFMRKYGNALMQLAGED